MSVYASPRIESIMQQKVEAGLYADAESVLRAALRLLEERDRRLRRLRAAVFEGEEGDAIPVTPELRERLRQSALRRARAGEQPHPDVCP